MRELALLQHIYARSANLGDRVTTGPGDDLAVLRLNGRTLLVGVDQLADGVHFDRRHASLQRIARKAITRNLSDVAAMAALPVAAVASAMLPRDFTERRAHALFDAMQQTAGDYDCPMVGGDVAVWPHPLQLAVTVLAEPAGLEPVLRSGAKPGDAVFVSGLLGNAWSPLAAETDAQPHADFEPRIPLARELRQRLGDDLHSMIDLSDGLGSDLMRICERSHVAAVVEVDRLPLRPVPRPRPELRSPWQAALADGEDYELCFTIAADAADRLPQELAGVPLTRIGRIITARAAGRGGGSEGNRGDGGGGERVELQFADGQREILTVTGWEHRS